MIVVPVNCYNALLIIRNPFSNSSGVSDAYPSLIDRFKLIPLFDGSLQ